MREPDVARRVQTTILMAASLAFLPVVRADDFVTDDEGHRFRVRFDPHHACRVGWTGGLGGGGGKEGIGQQSFLLLGLRLRSRMDFTDREEHITWFLDHRLLDGRIAPWSRSASAVPALDVRAYAGTYARHTREPYLVLPVSPPRRLYFPFDVGLEVEAGRVRTFTGPGERERLTLGLARAAVLLDPWRAGRAGDGLQFGIGVRYELDFLGVPALRDAEVVHRVAPFTDASVRFRCQDRSGRTLLDARLHVVPHWASPRAWHFLFEGAVRFERVLVADNDEPISLVIAGDVRRLPGAVDRPTRVAFSATAGLALGFQLDGKGR